MKLSGKLIVTLSAGAYFLSCALHPENWHFIDNINLIIHEAGHVLFLPFGQFLYVLGGSLTQALLPLAFAFYFWRKEQKFSATLTLFWVGQSLLNVYVYAADAITMQLPLITGDTSSHDWNWLLIYTGTLRHTAGIAFTLYALGTIIISLAFVLGLYFSLKTQAPEGYTTHEGTP